MAKTPMWVKPLSEVLGYQTQTIVKKSIRTGNTYEVAEIPQIEAVCMGAPEAVIKNGQKNYKYSIFDMKKDLQYQVTCPNFLKVSGVKQVVLRHVIGGALNNGYGWYKADSIAFLNSGQKA